MTDLTGSKILIIDFPEACHLRARLMSAGAIVHVVTPAGALHLARTTRIDVAFVGFSLDSATRHLCEQLTTLGVSQIILGSNDVDSERLAAQRAMLPQIIQGLSRVRRIRQPAALSH